MVFSSSVISFGGADLSGALGAMWTTGLAPEAPAARGLMEPVAEPGVILGAGLEADVAAGVGDCAGARVISIERRAAGRKA